MDLQRLSKTGFGDKDQRSSVGLNLKNRYNKEKLVLEGFFDFEETYVLKKLRSGDCVGLRALLSESIDPDGKLQQDVPSCLQEAMFSVVSSSANLRVIEINTHDLSNIPPYIRQKMKDGAKDFKDHDLLDDEKLIKLEFQTWEKIKQNMTIETIKIQNEIKRKKEFWETK